MQEINNIVPNIYKSEQAAYEVLSRYKECLRSWPVPSEQLYIPTSQGKTFVIASGPENALPVVLLHGTMSNSAAWMSEIGTWTKNYRVYAIDIIGDAGLSAPSRPSFSSDAYVLWLRDVLDGLDIGSASIVGTSMGGAIALDFAINLPERVGSLVLMCPGGVADKNIIWWALPLLLLGSWGARKVRERIIGRFHPKSDEKKKVAELMDLIFKKMIPRKENLPSFTDEQLNQLKMPVFVLLGEQDVTMDSQHIKHRFEQHVPHAEILIDSEARHYLGDKSTAIAEFLRRTYQEGENNV